MNGDILNGFIAKPQGILYRLRYVTLKEVRYTALLSFLQSPESKNLRDETEKYLAECKEVKVQIYYREGKVKCELRLEGEE